MNNLLNDCNYLKKRFEKLDVYSEVDEIFHGLMTDGSLNNLQRLKQLLHARRDVFREYKHIVKKLLVDQYFEDPSLNESIQFEKSGRVVFQGNIDLSILQKTYFPSLIRKVTGTLDLTGSQISHLDFIEVAGSLWATGSSLKSLQRLQHVNGYMHLDLTDIESLPLLKYIGGDLQAQKSELSSAPQLERVMGNVYLRKSKIHSLPRLRYVGGSFHGQNSWKLEKIPALERVMGSFSVPFRIKELNALTYVGEDFIVPNMSQLESVPVLEEIGGDFKVLNSFLQSLPELEHVGGDFKANGSRIKRVDSLKTVAGAFILSSETPIESIPELTEIGKDFDAVNNQHLRSLASLSIVGGDLNLGGTKVEDLSNLKTVSGRCNFNHVVSLKKLPEIIEVGSLVINNSSLRYFPKLQSIKAFHGYNLVITDFAKAFPNLREIGESIVSVFINDPVLAEQIQQLVEEGRITLKGEVKVDE
jgi:hypothetical protein